MAMQQSGTEKPLDNLTHDLLTICYEKSKGLEGYQKYLQDAQNDEKVSSLLNELKIQDAQAVQRLQTEIHRVLGTNSQNNSQTA